MVEAHGGVHVGGDQGEVVDPPPVDVVGLCGHRPILRPSSAFRGLGPRSWTRPAAGAISGGVRTLAQTAVDQLAGSFGGDLVRPDDAGYDEHRKVWNGSIDRRPGLIARCRGVADVRAAVRFGREHDLVVAVRGGGHSFPGLSVCDDGMVIDLGPMRGIRVDPVARTVRAQAGVLLGELDRETQEFGLAVPAGIVTHTGLAGLTLGRRHRLDHAQVRPHHRPAALGRRGHGRRRVRPGQRGREPGPVLGRPGRRRQLRHRDRLRVPTEPARSRGGRGPGVLAR